jgi:putative sigma-54 modulation protein
MKVTYKGKLDSLVDEQRTKLEAKLAKLAKVVDGREEREAHFMLTSERHVHNAEITVSVRDHVMVGIGASPDLLTAMTSAIDKLEKQVRKLRAKFRDKNRGPEKSLRTKPLDEPEAVPADEEQAVSPEEKRVFRVNHRANQKPLTIDEALMKMEDGRNYLVFRDAENDQLAVMLRRDDGNFDLVES